MGFQSALSRLSADQAEGGGEGDEDQEESYEDCHDLSMLPPAVRATVAVMPYIYKILPTVG